MKRYALLFLMLLGISSTAFGICRIGVDVAEPVLCDATTISVSGYICCTGEWEFDSYDVSQFGSQIIVDVYLNCTSLTGCNCVPVEEPLDLELNCPLHCGLYVLVVRVWFTYEGCACYPYCCLPQPLLRGMAMTSVKVCCDECGCYPCCCGLTWPCCLR